MATPLYHSRPPTLRVSRKPDRAWGLAYGRQGRFITGTVRPVTPSARTEWQVRTGDEDWWPDIYPRKADAIDAWKNWAARQWARDLRTPETPSQVLPVDVLVPPPVIVGLDPSGIEDAADPFDVLLRYPADHPDPQRRKHTTPLGALVNILDWCDRYETQITNMVERLECYNVFDPLIRAVRECVHREQTIHERPAHAQAQSSQTLPGHFPARNLGGTGSDGSLPVSSTGAPGGGEDPGPPDFIPDPPF